MATQRPTGLLAPLPVPARHFGSWSMDFIVDLMPCQNFNTIHTCIDRLTKLFRILPCRMGEGNLSAANVAHLFFVAVVQHHGLPDDVVHDRNP